MAAVSDRARTTLHVAAEVLRNPTLRRVELAFLAFSTVEYGAWVAVLLYAYTATGPASVGVVALIQLVPAALIAPFSATLGDRYPRQHVLLAAYWSMAALLALVAAGMLLGWEPAAVYGCAILVAFPLTLVRPAHNALLPSLAHDPSELTAANAVTSIAEACGILVGPLAAAAILVVAEPGAVIGCLAVVAAIAGLLVVGLRPHHAGAGAAIDLSRAGTLHVAEAVAADAVTGDDVEQADDAGPAILGGFRALAADADARLVVAILSARTLMIGVTDVLFVLLALEVFGTGESGAALLSAAVGAGGIVGGAAAFTLIGRRRMAPVLLGCGLAWGAVFALLGVGSGTFAPLLLIIGGTGLAVMDVAGRTILQRAVRDTVLARVFGILEGLMMAALAVGSVLVPIVIAAVGIDRAILVFAAFLPLVLLVAWPGLRALDSRSDVPVRALGLLRAVRMFEALGAPVIESLARSATWLTVDAGVEVIREGDAGDRYYVLESGAVAVSRGGTPLRILGSRGDSFGEIALLRDIPRTATVTTTTETELLALGRAEFLAAVTGHPVATAEAGRVVDAHLLSDRQAGG